MKRELKQTRDGSRTLFVPELNEHYHSVHGAVTESLHVFIQNGLRYAQEKFSKINLLEVGMGTGLNAALTLQHSGNNEMHYTALEPFPPELPLVKELNYGSWIDESLLLALHKLPYEVTQTLQPGFHFTKRKTSILDFQTIETFHLIYYDAFAPHAQPELWTPSLFDTLFAWMCEEGALVTYCAKGDVKRALKAAGFLVQTLPGPPGKREMVRAVKST